MTRTPLAACPGCARHVRVNEPACPFCRAELPASFRQLPPPPSPAKRLSRAALYALGVGALSATAACGSPFSSEEGLAVPYGLPPFGNDADIPVDADVDDASGSLDSAAPFDAGVVLDARVDDARVRRDSAVPADGDVAVDTGADDASAHLDSAVAADANEAQDASVDDASATVDSAAPIDAHVEDHISIRPLYGAPIIVGQ
ncbi:MAG: RING finger protein [Polyangiaceae bacterium]